MPAERLLPTTEARDLVALIREFARDRLASSADEAERIERFPREELKTLGELGLLGLPYPEAQGGGGQPYEVYLHCLEEVATAWASVALGVSVHVMSCFGLAGWGSPKQQRTTLPDLVGGNLLGGYCLSESDAGSDPAAMRATARRDGDHYILNGAKAWVTHGGQADFYVVMARTGEGRGGISSFLVPADTPGVTTGPPEDKMGMRASTTAVVRLDDVAAPAGSRIGEEGDGLRIALASLDAGRLGIAAIATGLAQAALDEALAYARQRRTFGSRIIDHQGLGFLLADMEAAVQSSRAMMLHAARLKDAGRPYSRAASIAKLVATDNAMKVTTDAVQVFGGNGYTKDFPAERYMREAKVMQIFEGTNQIQRVVISRSLDREPPARVLGPNASLQIPTTAGSR